MQAAASAWIWQAGPQATYKHAAARRKQRDELTPGHQNEQIRLSIIASSLQISVLLAQEIHAPQSVGHCLTPLGYLRLSSLAWLASPESGSPSAPEGSPPAAATRYTCLVVTLVRHTWCAVNKRMSEGVGLQATNRITQRPSNAAPRFPDWRLFQLALPKTTFVTTIPGQTRAAHEAGSWGQKRASSPPLQGPYLNTCLAQLSTHRALAALQHQLRRTFRAEGVPTRAKDHDVLGDGVEAHRALQAAALRACRVSSGVHMPGGVGGAKKPPKSTAPWPFL
jgi:hypothetical protein